MEERLAARQRPAGSPLLFMEWHRLLFLHWSWDPAQIQALLPPGLSVDTHENQGWLGIVPFFMRRVHPRGLPCLPWVSDFLELNVRTYVHDGRGTPGVWFTSLSCNQPIAVLGARTFFHLNYVHARMQAREMGQQVAYESSRRGQDSARYRYQIPATGHPAEPGTLEFFLLERYVLFSSNARGRLFSGRVHHAPYQVATGDLPEWSFAPAVADGFALDGRAPEHVTMSDRVEVGAWALQAHPAGSQGSLDSGEV